MVSLSLSFPPTILSLNGFGRDQKLQWSDWNYKLKRDQNEVKMRAAVHVIFLFNARKSSHMCYLYKSGFYPFDSGVLPLLLTILA